MHSAERLVVVADAAVAVVDNLLQQQHRLPMSTFGPFVPVDWTMGSNLQPPGENADRSIGRYSEIGSQ